MTTAAHAQELFRRAQAVCFDVDSTVIREEGIDELAKFCGVGDAVTEMSAHTHTHTHTHSPCPKYAHLRSLLLSACMTYFLSE